jgi:tetratricopeptide (TPR) repeat protein
VRGLALARYSGRAVFSRSNLVRLFRCLTAVLLTLTLSATIVAAAQSAEMAARADQAKQAMAADRFDEAAAIYREILQKLPDEPGILMNLGMALAMSGQSKEAIQPLSRALELRPTLMPAALFLGQSHLDLGQPEQAIAPLQKFVTAQPANLQARQMLASANLMAGRHQQAAAEFRKVTQQAPADAKGWYGLVQSYDALSQETLDALTKTAEGSVYEPLLMADALESEGKLEQAFAFYKQSLEKLPNLRATHEALARIYTKTGHADWAAQQTAKARQLAPACAEGAAAGAGAAAKAPAAAAGGAKDAKDGKNAECEFRAKRYLNTITAVAKREDAESLYWRTRAYAELASGALAKLTAMKPSLELHELRAELYRNQRRHLQSVAELKAALTFAPNDPRLRRELAKSYYYARDWDSARKLFEDLIKEAGRESDPELEYFYGDVLLQSQQAEAALPHLKAAVDGAPDMPPAHAIYGRALVQLGRFAEAIPHLETVLDDDEDGSLHYQLARAYQATGQAEKAKPLLEKYQQMQRAAQPAANSGPPPAITPPGAN